MDNFFHILFGMLATVGFLHYHDISSGLQVMAISFFSDAELATLDLGFVGKTLFQLFLEVDGSIQNRVLHANCIPLFGRNPQLR